MRSSRANGKCVLLRVSVHTDRDDPDTSRIFWTDGGVHQNITFPVHPDPISGMHCWHQKVTVEKGTRGGQIR